MIKIKTENGNTNVLLRLEEGVVLQDEIVQIITSSLLAFRQQIEKTGQNLLDADKDAVIIMNRSAETYREVIGRSQNIEDDNSMGDIMRQVDELIRKENR